MFSQIGPMEIVIVLVVALLLLGPKRLPEAGRGLGRGIREFKESVTGATRSEERPELDSAALAASAQGREAQRRGA
jgi:sec-independent protein translocase protein TatA